MVGEDEVDRNGNKIRILLIFFMFKKSTRAGYLTYGARKDFNYLHYSFTQTPIF